MNDSSPIDSIGTAEMLEDGTLWLRLYAVTGDIKGQSLKIIKKDDPTYKSIIAKLGGITPGEYKNIPPFTV